MTKSNAPFVPYLPEHIQGLNATLDSLNAGVINNANQIVGVQAGVTNNTNQIATLDAAAEKKANKGVVNGYCDLDSSGLIPDARIPEDVRQQLVGTTAEIAAAVLLRGQIAFSIVGSNVIAYVGDGVLPTGGYVFGGTAFPNSDLYARYDPTASGGAGSGDGVALTQFGLLKVKSGVTDAGLDQRTQGNGYFRVRGTNNAVPATSPGINSFDLQIKRDTAVGAQEQSQYFLGENINGLARGCSAVGGSITSDAGFGSTRVTPQSQANAGWNLTTYGTRAGNFGYGNKVGGNDIGASGVNCLAGSPLAGSGPGWVSGYKAKGVGVNFSAFGHLSSSIGVPSSASQRRVPVTISTVAGVTTVSLTGFGDLTTTYAPNNAPVVLWAMNGSNSNSSQGWTWVSEVASSSYNSGTGTTSIVLTDALLNTAITSGFIVLFSALTTSQANAAAMGHACSSLAKRAAALGYGGQACVDNTTNIGGAIISRKDYGDIASGEEIQALAGAVVTIYSKLIDLTVVAVAPAISIPANSVFFPHECGVEIRSDYNTVTVQSTVKVGISGNTAKHRAAAITTQLTAANRQDKSAVTTNDGETTLQGEVTVAATATTCKGYFFWTGRLVQTA